jgi:hypothetical protein
VTATKDDGWWARRLGNPPAPQQQSSYPPTQYQPMAAPTYAPQQPQYAPQGQPQQQPVPPGQMNVMDAIQRWQGGPAHRTDPYPCPACGSMHYFSRVNGPSRGPAPAPICYSCGYNGLFSQGDPAVWQGGS